MTIENFDLLSAFLIGIAGSVHCVGMCGGIVGAFSFAIPKQASQVPYLLAYNVGRIFSYVIAGMITGAMGAYFSASVNMGLSVLKLLSAIMLLLLALYIGGWWKVLTHLEHAGTRIWRFISPLGKKLIPFRSPVYAIPYGMVWGWLPCGLVYSTLSWSLAAGNAFQGALVMLSFGMGTLPAMLLLGTSALHIKPLLTKSVVRKSIALVLLAYAGVLLYGLAHHISG